MTKNGYLETAEGRKQLEDYFLKFLDKKIHEAKHGTLGVTYFYPEVTAEKMSSYRKKQ